MTFFCDNNISIKIAKMLNILAEPHHKIIHLTDEYDPDTPDPVWLTEIKPKDYVIITGDYKIGTNPLQREALRDSGKVTFFLQKGWMNLNLYIMASQLIKIFPDIVRTVNEANPKSVFGITKYGKIEQKQ